MDKSIDQILQAASDSLHAAAGRLETANYQASSVESILLLDYIKQCRELQAKVQYLAQAIVPSKDT